MDIGYARVSRPDQSLDRQISELEAAGCEQIHRESASGKKGATRPVWDQCLTSLRKGDTLVVTVLSRLGRSTSTLAALADDLKDRRINLRILNLGIDTTAIGRRRSITDRQITQAQAFYDERRFTMAQIARLVGTSQATLYRYLETGSRVA